MQNAFVHTEKPENDAETARKDGSNPVLQLASSNPVHATKPAEPKQTETGKKTVMELDIDPVREQLNTYVAEGDVVLGSLKVKGGARIAGSVAGDLVCENGSAIIEATGSVEGSIAATMRIVIAGMVGHGSDSTNKEVVCRGDVIMLGSGQAIGNVYYGNLVTYDGGEIEGRVAPFKSYKPA